jgi:hypothetical protein
VVAVIRVAAAQPNLVEEAAAEIDFAAHVTAVLADVDPRRFLLGA